MLSEQSLKSTLTDAMYLASVVYLGSTRAIGEAYLILLLFAFIQSRYGVGLMKSANTLVSTTTGMNPPSSGGGSGGLSSGTSTPRMEAVREPPKSLRQTFLGWFSPNPVWVLLVVASVLLYAVSFAKTIR